MFFSIDFLFSVFSISGSVVFNKPLSAFNWVGIVVALAGVMWYSYLVNEENEKKKIANDVKKNS